MEAKTVLTEQLRTNKKVLTLSSKGSDLISMYEDMVENGYERLTGPRQHQVYENFELKLMKKTVKDIFDRFSIKTVLDYGSGGCNWSNLGFDESGISAIQYFGLDHVQYYEPTRRIDERGKVDCVISFDVLEHVFVSDVPKVLYDMFSYAKKLIVLNVACYKAKALLPNGENAHITVRHPHWWKGMVDSCSVDFPDLQVLLLTSLDRGQAHQFPIFSDRARHEDQRFDISY